MIGSVASVQFILLQVTDVQDMFDEVYKQFVELNDIINQHVSMAIQYVVRVMSCCPPYCVLCHVMFSPYCVLCCVMSPYCVLCYVMLSPYCVLCYVNIYCHMVIIAQGGALV